MQLKGTLGVVLAELDMGGGLGISYLPDDAPAEVRDLVCTVVQAVQSACSAHNFPLPKLVFEPGRSIVGPAGWAIYRVGGLEKRFPAFVPISPWTAE